jgi:kynurenine 3-monooxygenase
VGAQPAKFTVAGGGLGGALMAIYLARAGHEVELFERRDDPRKGGAGSGRSINLAISTRGLHALEGAGLAREILQVAVPMRGRMVHTPAGETRFQPYGTRADQVINSVSRGGLNILLLSAAERYPNVRIHFARRCTGADLETGTAAFTDTRSGETITAAGDALIGADGAYSAVRMEMQRHEGFNFRQDYLEHGYKELSMPPAEGGGFRMEKNALHIWPRGASMMIALPNFDGSYTCTCFWPLAGPGSFGALKTKEEVLRHFTAHFPDAVPRMPSLAEDYFENPTGTLVTIRCAPWHHRGRVALLGDACHAVVPFYGQGANAAFEDCVVLDECLARSAPDREKAFAEYQSLRRENTDALADLSLANFIEMRDKTASRLFFLEKQMEKGLHRLFPAWFVPLYTMVTFSRTPYARAMRRARRQWLAFGAAAAVLALALLLLILWGLPWN